MTSVAYDLNVISILPSPITKSSSHYASGTVTFRIRNNGPSSQDALLNYNITDPSGTMIYNKSFTTYTEAYSTINVSEAFNFYCASSGNFIMRAELQTIYSPHPSSQQAFTIIESQPGEGGIITVYVLTISVVGSGTTNPIPGSYNIQYSYNSYTNVTAVPTPLISGFVYWELDGVNYTNNPITVYMNRSHTLVAHFGSNNNQVPVDVSQVTDRLTGLINNFTKAIMMQTLQVYNGLALKTARSPLVYIPAVPVFQGTLVEQYSTVWYGVPADCYKFSLIGDSLAHKEAIGLLQIDGARKVDAVFLISNGQNIPIGYQFNYSGLPEGILLMSQSQSILTAGETYIWVSMYNCEMNFSRTYVVYTEESGIINSYSAPFYGTIETGYFVALIVAFVLAILAKARGYGMAGCLLTLVGSFTLIVLLLHVSPYTLGGYLDITVGLLGLACLVVCIASGKGAETHRK